MIQVVSFGQGEVEKDVSVSLPFAGIYTVRALAYNDVDRTDISHWLRSELEGFVVPQGGGVARQVPIVHRGIRVSVHVARIPSLSTELLRRLERGGHEVTALVQEGEMEPYAIGDIRLVEQNE